MIYGLGHSESEFEIEVCTNDEHIVARMCPLSLKCETEVKEWMIKWTKNFGHNIPIEAGKVFGWKNWNVHYVINLKHFKNMIYCWYLSPENYTECIKAVQIYAGSANNKKGHFIMFGGYVTKTWEFWIQIYTLIILKVKTQLKPGASFSDW